MIIKEWRKDTHGHNLKSRLGFVVENLEQLALNLALYDVVEGLQKL